MVEDDLLVARDLADSVAAMGYHALPPLPTAEGALKVARESEVSLALVDIRLAGRMDGCELAEELHRDYGVPVVFVTAQFDGAVIEAAKRSYPYGYLIKPISQDELSATVQLALYKSSADRQMAQNGPAPGPSREAPRYRPLEEPAHPLSSPYAYDKEWPRRLLGGVVRRLAKSPNLQAVRELILEEGRNLTGSSWGAALHRDGSGEWRMVAASRPAGGGELGPGLRDWLDRADGPLQDPRTQDAAWTDQAALAPGRLMQLLGAAVPGHHAEQGLLLFARESPLYAEHHAALLEHLALLYSFALRSYLPHAEIGPLRRQPEPPPDRAGRSQPLESSGLASFLEETLGRKLYACSRLLKDLERTQPEHTKVLDQVVDLLDEGLSELQFVTARFQYPHQQEDSLADCLGWLVRRERRRLGLEVSLEQTGDEPELDQHQKAFLYRAAQELVANAFRHGAATRVGMTLEAGPDAVQLVIADNGAGFRGVKPDDIYSRGLGIFTLKEQSVSLGGSLTLENQAQGGVRATVALPVKPLAPQPAAGRPIPVLLAESHPLTRMGLGGLLRSRPGLKMLGEAGDWRQAMELCRSQAPEVIILDTGLPEMDPAQAARQLAAEFPSLAIIAFSTREDSQLVHDLLAAGASAYLLKSAELEELIKAVEVVHEGGVYLSPEVTNLVIQNIQRPQRPRGESLLGSLTSRERELLNLMADAKSTKEIARELGLSVNTVYVHRRNIMEKLQVKNSAEMIKLALRLGVSGRD